MHFQVQGPFKLKRFGDRKLITKETLTCLIEDAEKAKKGLSNSCGCYVFAIRAAKGIVPWYVGQANRTTLLKEALNASNREKYNTVFDKQAIKNGTPVLFLLPKVTTTGNHFAKPTNASSGYASVNFLEDWLIACALQKNSKMINNKKTFFLRKLHITGLFNANHGEATTPSSALRRTLGL